MDPLKVRGSLEKLLPGRKKQWSTLLGLLGGGGAVPASIFLYGHTATGKTHVVNTVLEQMESHFIRVNCVEYDSVQLLVAPIAAKISDIYLDEEDSKKCTTLMGLVDVMEKASKTKENKEHPFIIVLERSERLRNLSANTLPALIRLQELSGMNVCVLMLSDIVWDKFFGKSWFCKPIKIFFPQYTKGEIQNILVTKKPSNVPEGVYTSYVQIIINVLYRFCRDLNELQYMVQQHWQFVPDESDVRIIYKAIIPHLKNSMKIVHLRQGVRNNTATNDPLNPLTTTVSGLELPYYAKYLLIAAFLASFNSPKHDKRLFMKYHGKERKRLNNKNQKHQVKLSSLLVGPKPFNFERLSAIFHAIADIKCTLSTNFCAQLTSLVNLKLISRVGNAALNDPKYKCAAGLDFVTSVADTVQFNVSKYIMENH